MIKVAYSVIKPYANKAAKDHVSVNETKDTTWFAIDQTNDPFPFCALMQTSKGYRIKGVWVPPMQRGKGIGTQMTLKLMDYAENTLMASRIEVFAYNPAFYERNGYKRFGSLPNGAIKLEKIL
jgi:RimJ/RimL family protein N-acetyltransferase